MAFKMRSGNKISFKSMGSSPVKQSAATDEGLVSIGKTDADVFRNNEAKIELLKLQNQERERKEKEAGEKEAKRPTVDKLRDRSKKEEQDVSGEILSENRDAPDGDNDMNQYKSKEQIKQDNKTRKLISRKNSSDEVGGPNNLSDYSEDRKIFGMKVGTRQYTKAEKARDKDAHLADKLQREKGTGENAYSFNLKNALLGDSFASGLTYGAKHKKTQKKINKRAKKVASDEAKISGKYQRKDIKRNAKESKDSKNKK